MALGIGATSVLGLAVESSRGTYVAPTKWVPMRSESLTVSQSLTYRRNIQGTADPQAPFAGNLTISGDIELECYPDVIPYLFKAMRTNETKTNPSYYQYVYIPLSTAQSTSSLSFYIERNGVRFAYAGCSITNISFNINDGILVATATVQALSEATQSAASESYSNNSPFSTGDYTVYVPNSSSITDVDNFTFSIEEGGEVNHRLNGSQNPASITMGERTVSCQMDRDFDSRTDYDNFKSANSTSLKILADVAGGGTRQLQFEVPQVNMESYDVNIGGVGELVRASVNYTGSYVSSSTAAYTVTIRTNENIS